ncbi:MAG TPA: hypothetical protein PLQ12_06305 [Candidatus Defluviicoccus seviourii]|nr:hypothetical protein [Candidatus Defluviicoccus seviourii]
MSGAAPALAVRVIDVKAVEGCGNLRAYATVAVGPLLIHGCRVVQQPGQRAWVSLPQTKSGERWFAVVEVEDRALKEAISAAVLDAWAGRS